MGATEHSMRFLPNSEDGISVLLVIQTAASWCSRLVTFPHVVGAVCSITASERANEGTFPLLRRRSALLSSSLVRCSHSLPRKRAETEERRGVQWRPPRALAHSRGLSFLRGGAAPARWSCTRVVPLWFLRRTGMAGYITITKFPSFFNMTHDSHLSIRLN